MALIDYSGAGDPMARPIARPSAVGSIAMDLACIVAAVILLGGIPSLGPVFYLGLPGALLILIALAMLLRAVRCGRAMLAIEHLEQAVRLNLPLPLMIEAAERAERGKARYRLAYFRDLLEHGLPIAASLYRSFPGISARMVGLIGSGERLGQLPHVLPRLIAQARKPKPRTAAQSIMLRWYPIVLLGCLVPAALALSVIVMPRYNQVLRGFHLPMPRFTVWMVDTLEILQIPLLVIGIIVVAVFSGRMLGLILPMRREPFAVWQFAVDRVAWITPLWRSVTRNQGYADLCDVLAGAAAAGQPMDRALAEASEGLSNRVLRRRVRRWSDLVSSGVPLAQAARKARMPRLMIAMLDTAQGTPGTPNVLEFLARYYDNRSDAASALLQGAAIPMMVAVAGVVVGALALGIFLPLIELAHRIPAVGGGRL